MKTKIIFFSLVIVSLFYLLVVSGSTGAEESKTFTVAYSNNVEGYLEPCG